MSSGVLEKIEIKVPIEPVDPALPRYVVVPSKVIGAWELERTTELDIEVNGKPGGRRRLRRWEDAHSYIQVPAPVCEACLSGWLRQPPKHILHPPLLPPGEGGALRAG